MFKQGKAEPPDSLKNGGEKPFSQNALCVDEFDFAQPPVVRTRERANRLFSPPSQVVLWTELMFGKTTLPISITRLPCIPSIFLSDKLVNASSGVASASWRIAALANAR